tara:strand:- start:616 stop:957 length:342 start_codon:yes stop_codon:yes gene_type:complete
MKLFLILLIYIYSTTYCQENDLPSDTTFIESIPLLIKPAMYTIEFYQNYLGKIKGSYCPMYPSCSEYGRLAISKNGFWGIIKTFDRLHRCSHDLENYDVIFFDGEMRYLDEPN